MDFFKNLKSFVIIYIIHKMLVLLITHLNFIKLVFLNGFLRSIIDLTFFITYDNGKCKS